MDVDMKRSSPSSSSEEHMDMATMMMHMEKLPDFYEPTYQTTATSSGPSPSLQELQFSSPPSLPIYPCPQPTSSPPYNINSAPISIPFMGTPVQEPNKCNYAPFLSNQATYLSSMEKKNSVVAVREMIFQIAAMQPIHIDPEAIKPPKRKNVKISKDPQSVAARHRRERISERIRILQRLVPGGTKMDTASMLDEAIHYVKFLKKQVQSLEQAGASGNSYNVRGNIVGAGFGLGSSGVAGPNLGYFSNLAKNSQPADMSMVGSVEMLR